MKKRKNKFIKKFLMGFALFAFIFPLFLSTTMIANARIELDPQVPFGEVKTGVTLPEYINAIYKYLIGAGGVLAGIMLAVGGFMYVSSAGDSGKASSGKKYIINALVGMVLLASSYTIIYTINPAATEMPDIEVSEIDANVITPKGDLCGVQGLACSSDSQCPSSQYCATNFKEEFAPYRQEYVAPDVVTSIETAAHYITEYGGYAMMGAGLLQNALQSTARMTIMGSVRALATKGVKKMATALLNSAKYVFKPVTLKNLLFYPLKAAWQATKLIVTSSTKLITYPVRNPTKFFKAVNNMGFWVGATYQVSKTGVNMLVAETDACPSTGEGKGICLSKFYKYNLIPQGMKYSDQDAIHLDIQTKIVEGEEIGEYILAPIPSSYREKFLYNSDGSLPDRSIMFLTSNTNVPYYHAPPFGSMEKVKFQFKGTIYEGQANTDACDPDNNHCPCIEWNTYDQATGTFDCKRQARCVLGSDLLKLGGEHNNVSFCLTGDQGEPCLSDNDCRSGNRCLVIDEEIVGKASSLVMKGIKVDDQVSRDDIGWKLVGMKDDYWYQKQCIDLNSFSSSGGGSVDTICQANLNEDIKLCELNTGIDKKPCKEVKTGDNTVVSTECTNLVLPVYQLYNNKMTWMYEAMFYDSEKKRPVFIRRAGGKVGGSLSCYEDYKNVDADKLYTAIKFYWESMFNNPDNGWKELIISTRERPLDVTDDYSITIKQQESFIDSLGIKLGDLFHSKLDSSAKLKILLNNKNNYAYNENCYLKINSGFLAEMSGISGFGELEIHNIYANLSTLVEQEELSMYAKKNSDWFKSLIPEKSTSKKAILDLYWIQFKEISN